MAVGHGSRTETTGELPIVLSVGLPWKRHRRWQENVDSARTRDCLGGFRGHRALGPATNSIILVGDSRVETAMPFEQMPEVYLGAALRQLTHRDTRVVSVAAAGWGQDQELLALRQALPAIRPQMVLLWFTPANDLWNNTFPTHMPKDGTPKPTFWLEGDTLHGPHATHEGNRYFMTELARDLAKRLSP